MRKNDVREGKNDPEANQYDFYQGLNIESQMECTGMIPTPPIDEAQLDGYHDIYSVPQQCASAAGESKNAADQKKKSSRPRPDGREPK